MIQNKEKRLLLRNPKKEKKYKEKTTGLKNEQEIVEDLVKAQNSRNHVQIGGIRHSGVIIGPGLTQILDV